MLPATSPKQERILDNIALFRRRFTRSPLRIPLNCPGAGFRDCRLSQRADAVDNRRNGPGHGLKQLVQVVDDDLYAGISIAYSIPGQPRQTFAGRGIVFAGMLPHDCGKRRQIVGVAVVIVERGNPAFQRVFNWTGSTPIVPPYSCSALP